MPASATSLIAGNDVPSDNLSVAHPHLRDAVAVAIAAATAATALYYMALDLRRRRTNRLSSLGFPIFMC
ncbi:hypothetical protein CGRA01v4_02476 [Colletotrichum graminicola]|uniref:Uncharacterized protein n=1 Tax=Colletotrichum graminicola (strain M1.001 / M2 / FGSC 10212) TaxID=645133 RepID=E3Q3B5_COLGM|nr:uncharacterized protein GLRG_00661 [Colletotrichum graminicola M1.001]EFQ25517.1 hypothetical protein GLRG_00661 [Colletotrichum graminicola M1.001]WDK11197.1 hypothetical protein CGRA01v4_02476 [Colletotrichum graminicola]